MQPSQSFQYDGLDRSQREIRLIKLSPFRRDGHIECKIVKTTLPARYHALSYTWGSNVKTHQITMTSPGTKTRASLGITANLYDFLQQMVSARFTQMLWIDSICIDQNNTAERGHQVQLMGDLYRGAEQVFLWLGTDTRIAHFLQRIKQSPDARFSYSPLTGLVANESLNSLLQDSTFLDSCNAIQEHSYWSRVWVKQEIVLAKSVEVVCAETSLSGSKFQALLHLARRSTIGQRAWQYDALQNEASMWQLIALAQNSTRYHSRMDTRLLSVLRDSKCHDIRDKIYGALSFVGDAEHFPASYDIGTEELFFRTWEHCRLWVSWRSYTDLMDLLELDLKKLLVHAIHSSGPDLQLPNVNLSLSFQDPSIQAMLCSQCELRYTALDACYHTSRYAFWCAKADQPHSRHILFERDNIVNKTTAQNLTAVGLVTSNGAVRSFRTPEITTEFMYSCIKARLTGLNDEKHHTVDISMPRLGLIAILWGNSGDQDPAKD